MARPTQAKLKVFCDGHCVPALQTRTAVLVLEDHLGDDSDRHFHEWPFSKLPMLNLHTQHIADLDEPATESARCLHSLEKLLVAQLGDTCHLLVAHACWNAKHLLYASPLACHPLLHTVNQLCQFH